MLSRSVRTRWIIACGVGLAVAAPIRAQDIGPVFDMGVLTNTLTIPTEVPGADKRPAGPARSGGNAVPGSDIRLAYTATPELRRAALAGYISRISRENPAAAKTLAVQFAKYDAGTIYRGIAAPYGLNENDAADVLTMYTVLGWLIATGAAEPSPIAVRAARRQIAPGLAANPELSRRETRAQLGEELKLLFVTLHAGWQDARRAGNLQDYSDGVATMFKTQSGRDLRAVRLTDAGFSRR